MARFDEVRTTFWGEGRYGVQPPLTDAAIEDAERRLGVRLPVSLLEILRVQLSCSDHWSCPDHSREGSGRPAGVGV